MALFSSRIKALEADLLQMTSARDALQLSVTELSDANALCDTQHTADKAALAALTTERDTALASLGTVTTERDAARGELATERADREATISTQVNARLGSAGVDPIKRDPAAVDMKGSGKPAGTARERLAADFNSQISK